MPKPAKILIGVLIGYAGLVVAFESMLGFLQPEQGVVLTIVTTGEDGIANDRVQLFLTNVRIKFRQCGKPLKFNGLHFFDPSSSRCH